MLAKRRLQPVAYSRSDTQDPHSSSKMSSLKQKLKQKKRKRPPKPTTTDEDEVSLLINAHDSQVLCRATSVAVLTA